MRARAFRLGFFCLFRRVVSSAFAGHAAGGARSSRAWRRGPGAACRGVRGRGDSWVAGAGARAPERVWSSWVSRFAPDARWGWWGRAPDPWRERSVAAGHDDRTRL